MKFVVDAQLPPKLADWLRAHGHEAVAVREAGLRDAGDARIWAYALREDAIIVTKDEDFALLASAQKGPSILWVRTGNVTSRALLARFEASWEEISSHLVSGARIVELH